VTIAASSAWTMGRELSGLPIAMRCETHFRHSSTISRWALSGCANHHPKPMVEVVQDDEDPATLGAECVFGRNADVIEGDIGCAHCNVGVSHERVREGKGR